MDRRIWAHLWQPPRTHRDVVSERRVSFLELFYDLIYVVLIARVAHVLHGSITVAAVGTFAVLFGLLWIGWWNGTLLLDAHGRPDMRNRSLTFLQMFAIAVMAVFAPTAEGEGGRGFALAYAAFLVILTWQWWAVTRTERDDPQYGPIARRYTWSMAVMTAWVVVTVFVPDEARMCMWAAVVAQFVLGMLVLSSGLGSGGESGVAMASDSLLERFALFVIIVLGEVVAGVVNGLGAVEHLTVETFLTGFLGLAVGMALWWSCFDLLSMRPPQEGVRPRVLFNLGQLPLTLAIAGVGGATVSLIEHTGEVDPAANWAFGGFVALAQLSIAGLGWLLRDRDALMEMMRPALVWGGIVAALTLLLPLANPTGPVLALTLLIAMCLQWGFSVAGWWRTPEGIAKLEDELSTAGPTGQSVG